MDRESKTSVCYFCHKEIEWSVPRELIFKAIDNNTKRCISAWVHCETDLMHCETVATPIVVTKLLENQHKLAE